MTHLSPSEFVDLVDGVLDPVRASHLERCEAYRTQAHAMGRLIREAGSDTVPEPSPLFWDHFQQRMQRAIAAETSPRRSWFLVHPVPKQRTPCWN